MLKKRTADFGPAHQISTILSVRVWDTPVVTSTGLNNAITEHMDEAVLSISLSNRSMKNHSGIVQPGNWEVYHRRSRTSPSLEEYPTSKCVGRVKAFSGSGQSQNTKITKKTAVKEKLKTTSYT